MICSYYRKELLRAQPFCSSDETQVYFLAVQEEFHEQGCLSDDEWKRGQRFHRNADRWEYLGARRALRILLAGHLGVREDQLRFLKRENGKPYLESGYLFFNVSHSRGWAAIAISREGEVGVDLEESSKILSFPDLASQFFSRAEGEMLFSLSEDKQRELFYRLWTRKEAFLKAKGTGITKGLDHYEMIAGEGHCLEREGFQVLDLQKAPAGYFAALAYSKALKVKVFSCP